MTACPGMSLARAMPSSSVFRATMTQRSHYMSCWILQLGYRDPTSTYAGWWLPGVVTIYSWLCLDWY